jgi:uncharacterized protein (TIGR04255 family)
VASRQYKIPPIEEALCEFTFLTEAPSQIDFTLPGKLQMQPAMHEYSGIARTQNIQTTIFGAPNTLPVLQDALFRIQLPTPDGTKLVSIGADSVAVTVLRPYEGWEAFKPRIDAALQAYCETTKRYTIIRIGIRYINRIVVPTANVNASHYLAKMTADGEALGILQNSFMHKEEYARDDGVRVIVTQATLHPANPETTEYMVDVDTVWAAGKIEKHDEIMAKVELLHGIEGAAFEALITEKARELFDAE